MKRTDCGRRDTLKHRLVECGGEQRCLWASSRIARMLKTSPENIPRVWLTRPDFQFWPTQRQRAVLWMLALFVNFRLQKQRTLTAQDLMDFMRRAKRKVVMQKNRQKLVPNFLSLKLHTSQEVLRSKQVRSRRRSSAARMI